MERDNIVVTTDDSDIKIDINGSFVYNDATDLVLEAAVTLIEGFNSEDEIPMTEVENSIFCAFCDLVRQNHKYPEEITNKELINDFIDRYLDKA
ncbi:hypothetical protein [Bacillus toyonensis]|uniref:hypothetical protein n=1 Tax=Bacillus toyonensis TaxID=155322 RepID=UPI002E22BD8C|nr:hypothetical protein [Bacillus toyonensis]